MTTRVDRTLLPGDIVLIDFGPVRGTEQDGTRPALVISTREMHETTRHMVICPISRNPRPWPTKVFLPNGLAAHGAVLVDQVRAVDRGERILRKLGAAPDAILLEVRQKLAALLGIDFVVRRFTGNT
jgi:mRNA interferase MazF